jgi:predicted NBD/HSP70 family sugar kinase
MKRIYLQNSKTQIARPTTIRDINKKIVLNYIRDRSPISRADIARETDLQRSTISAIVDDLQKEDLIEEIGTGASSGGRKPTLLKIKTGIAVAVGVDVTPRKTTIAVADLAGQVLEQETFATSPNMEFMNEQIVQRVENFALKYPKSDLEVGISVPGIADQMSGQVKFVPYFQWRDWDIAGLIKKKTNLPATVENDANAIALAELWFGRDEIRKTTNFITVLIGEGIGTGIIFDGQIYRGENGAAGEFGHMIVGGDTAPVKCSCGSDDCWEAQASEKAILARYQCYLRKNNMSSESLAFRELISLANNGEELAQKVFRETAKYLGVGISNLIIGMSPQKVIVSGAITKVWNLISEELEHISERSVLGGLPKTMIIASTLGDSPTLIGALSLVLARKFASAS